MLKKKTLTFLLTILMLFSSCAVSDSSANVAENGWSYSNNTWHYYQNGAILKNGWALDSKGWCFLNAVDGSWVQEGWVLDSKGWRYIEKGYLVQNSMWAKDSSGWCYIGDDGYWDGKPALANIPEGALLRFVVMADCRGQNEGTINTDAVNKTLEEIKKLSPQPSFAAMPGDLAYCKSTYSDTKAELLSFKNIITKYYPIEFFYPGFGNHDAAAGIRGEEAFGEVFSEFKANFLNGYNRTVYYFDKNNLRFYMLNSNHPGENNMVSDVQLNWKKINTDSSKVRSFYFFHDPAYPTGAHVGSSLDINKIQRDKLWQVVDSSKNPMVFCGHEHNYTRRHINSDFNETINGQTFEYSKLVYQVTVGTFGAPTYNSYTDRKNVDIAPVTEYHFAVVDVNGSRVKVTVYNLYGKIIDQFEQ